MTMRITMNDLITDLRRLGMAGKTDFTIEGIQYWSNDQLQTVLDAHQTIYDFEDMTTFSQRSGSVYVWKIYETGVKWFEGTPSITDSIGTAVSGTAFSFDYHTGRVTFTDDQGGSARTFSGTAYNLYAAAADVWQQKADYYALAYDVSTDNHNLSRSQLLKQATERAKYYAAQARNAAPPGSGGGNSIDVERGDMNATCR